MNKIAYIKLIMLSICYICTSTLECAIAQGVTLDLIVETDLIIENEYGGIDNETIAEFEKQIHSIYSNIEAVTVSGNKLTAMNGFYGIKIYMSKTHDSDLYTITYVQFVKVSLDPNSNDSRASQLAFQGDANFFTEEPIGMIEVLAEEFEKNTIKPWKDAFK